MSKMLLDERPLLVGPRLAKTVGLNEAIVLQQIHYWLLDSQKVHEGRTWTYNTYKEWHKQMPWWSERTIRRTLDSLREMGLVIVGRFNKVGYDKTNWYTIDYDRLDKMASGSGQSGQIEEDKMATPIPKTTKTTTKTLPASENAGQLEELEYTPCDDEGNELDSSGRAVPQYLRPKLPIHYEVLKIRKARKFTAARQKSRLTGLAKAIEVGATSLSLKGEAVMYQTCLNALEKVDSEFVEEPLPPIPPTWLAFRLVWAKEKHWSIARTVEQLFSRQALISHCHYHLKQLGVSGAPAESTGDYVKRKGLVEVAPNVWEEQL